MLIHRNSILSQKQKRAKPVRSSNNFYFNINSIEYLQTVKSERVSRFTINVNGNDIDTAMVNDILPTT